MQVLNLLFPPQCLNCECRVPTHGTLCLSCWENIRFISEPMCACCGLPFEYAVDKNTLCGECLNEHPPYSRARAAFVYDEHSRSLILKLKYQDDTYLAKTYGPWLSKAGAELLAASDVIIPVPLHYWRFVARRYNQSALLANMLAKFATKPVLLDGLRRTRATEQQTGLTKSQREDNVRGAFSIHPKHATNIKGKSVLLIDDVITTGATLRHCTKALLKAGASQVNVLTLARRAQQ